MRVSPKFIIFFIVFVNLMGYGILFPLLPLYEAKMHVGPFVIAAVMGAYAIAQFFSAPILGILSDRYGRRPLLLFSLAGTVLSFVLFAFANNIWILFFARLLDGISGGNVSIAQAYMADITTKEERSKGMGQISGAISLGFMVGPVLGGVLGQYGVIVPSLAAAGIALTNFVLAIFFLKETEKEETKKRAMKLLPFKEIVRALRIEKVGICLVLFFLVQTAWSLHLPIFSLFLDKNFGIGTMFSGFLFAYRGVISSFVQLYLVGKVLKYFSEVKVLKIAIAVMVFGLLLTGMAPSVPILIIGLTFLELGGDFISPVTNGLISKSADQSEQGEIMGVAASMGSLGRIVGPYLGGASFEMIGSSSPFLIGAILMGLGMIVLGR